MSKYIISQQDIADLKRDIKQIDFFAYDRNGDRYTRHPTDVINDIFGIIDTYFEEWGNE